MLVEEKNYVCLSFEEINVLLENVQLRSLPDLIVRLDNLIQNTTDALEDKEAVFDAVDTVKMCLKVFSGMVATMKANTANMKLAAQKGFINATDLADYLVKKGMPFRSAYKISGQLVAQCIRENTVLENLPMEVYKGYSELFDQDLYEAIDLMVCVEKRISKGGTSVASVESQIAFVRNMLK